MFASLFISRVMLSVSMIAFLFFTCFHFSFIQQLRKFINCRLLVAISLLFFIPFLTWFWSDDKLMWARWARIKLPLFLLPLAFAGNWQLTPTQWRTIAWCLILLVFAGCCWSLFYYLKNPFLIQENYLRAKLMATPLGNDHVRFSLLVCLTVVFCVMLFVSADEKKSKTALAILATFFIIYMHVLSARTGLVGLYIFILAGIIRTIQDFKKNRWILTGTIILLLMPLAAWYFLPTFQNRFRYILYDFSFIRQQTYLPGSNDGSRMFSLRAGWEILKDHPAGVGSGDVVASANAWYNSHLPYMIETDKLYPSSEWLLYGDAAGWVGLILFTALMLIPFFEKTNLPFFWMIMNLIAGFSFLFDIGLESQYGVFIYAMLVLLMWKVVKRDKSIVKRET
jgi:O-antigen ligase